MQGKLMSLLPSDEFSFDINCFQKYLPGVRVECQTVWIQIMTDLLA